MATLSGDRIMQVPPGQTTPGVVAVAAVNIGARETVVVRPEFTGSPPPGALSFCETNPANGQCISALQSSLVLELAPNQVRTFTVAFGIDQFVGVASYPDVARVGLKFETTKPSLRGLASVAVTAPGPQSSNSAPVGIFNVRFSGDRKSTGHGAVLPNGRMFRWAPSGLVQAQVNAGQILSARPTFNATNFTFTAPNGRVREDLGKYDAPAAFAGNWTRNAGFSGVWIAPAPPVTTPSAASSDQGEFKAIRDLRFDRATSLSSLNGIWLYSPQGQALTNIIIQNGVMSGQLVPNSAITGTIAQAQAPYNLFSLTATSSQACPGSLASAQFDGYGFLDGQTLSLVLDARDAGPGIGFSLALTR
jgi:hypothetical protein